jgi:hypothetical protein
VAKKVRKNHQQLHNADMGRHRWLGEVRSNERVKNDDKENFEKKRCWEKE